MPMSRAQARETAREILKIVPLVMRTLAAELRANGELPALAHFGLLTLLCSESRTLSELAQRQGVSLPTMSNSITAMVERGWARRSSPERDRRVVVIDITASGRAVVERVGRAAEGRLAEMLAPVDAADARRIQAGLTVLRAVFGAPRAGNPKRSRVRTSGQ
jgi:DNA-binding MarR family transcriptional regulator